MNVKQITLEEITHNSNIKRNDKRKGRKEKIFEFSKVNNSYLESFKKSKYPYITTDQRQLTAWRQYKASLGNFLTQINKDAITITQNDIDEFLSDITNEKTKRNKTVHIKSLFIHILEKNISFCRQRASLFVLTFTCTVPEWFLNDKSLMNKYMGKDE